MSSSGFGRSLPLCRGTTKHLPTIQHVQLASGRVNVAVTAAHIIIGIRVRGALGGAVFLYLIASRSLLRNAERHGHLEHMSAAVGGPHFARTRVDASVRATGWPRHSPTRFPASARCLAVFTTRSHLECVRGCW